MKYLHVLLIIGIGIIIFFSSKYFSKNIVTSEINPLSSSESAIVESPLSISYMRKQVYPGSEIKIEQTLSDGYNYTKYVISYLSDNLKIYALMTVPKGVKPENGWPVIIFNHGYIPPREYITTEKYVAYIDAFSRAGYIVLKSDYRGHGNSEGEPGYPEYTPYYTIDILNAISSIKRYDSVNPTKIGIWGHSMGGNIALRTLVVNQDIKAASIWAGVIGTTQDLADYHRRRSADKYKTLSYSGESTGRTNGRARLIEQYGDTSTNPQFWTSIDPMTFIKDINIPIQLQHSKTDEEVPYILSQKIDIALRNSNKLVEFYSYEKDDHNFSNNLSTALKRSVEFFDKYLK